MSKAEESGFVVMLNGVKYLNFLSSEIIYKLN